MSTTRAYFMVVLSAGVNIVQIIVPVFVETVIILQLTDVLLLATECGFALFPVEFRLFFLTSAIRWWRRVVTWVYASAISIKRDGSTIWCVVLLLFFGRIPTWFVIFPWMKQG